MISLQDAYRFRIFRQSLIRFLWWLQLHICRQGFTYNHIVSKQRLWVICRIIFQQWLLAYMYTQFSLSSLPVWLFITTVSFRIELLRVQERTSLHTSSEIDSIDSGRSVWPWKFWSENLIRWLFESFSCWLFKQDLFSLHTVWNREMQLHF